MQRDIFEALSLVNDRATLERFRVNVFHADIGDVIFCGGVYSLVTDVVLEDSYVKVHTLDGTRFCGVEKWDPALRPANT